MSKILYFGEIKGSGIFSEAIERDVVSTINPAVVGSYIGHMADSFEALVVDPEYGVRDATPMKVFMARAKMVSLPVILFTHWKDVEIERRGLNVDYYNRVVYVLEGNSVGDLKRTLDEGRERLLGGESESRPD